LIGVEWRELTDTIHATGAGQQHSAKLDKGELLYDVIKKTGSHHAGITGHRLECARVYRISDRC
jgi:hypothetical protein